MGEPSEGDGARQGEWPGAIAAITLFVEDLEAAKGFYQEVFELPVVFEDDNSTVFRFGETVVNLLKTSEAPGWSRRRPSRPPTPVSASSSRSLWTTSTRCASA